MRCWYSDNNYIIYHCKNKCKIALTITFKSKFVREEHIEAEDLKKNEKKNVWYNIRNGSLTSGPMAVYGRLVSPYRDSPYTDIEPSVK